MSVSCPNIGPQQRRRRVRIAVALCGLATALAWGLVVSGAPRLTRLWVVLPLWPAVIAMFEVRRHVCVVLAATGVRDLDHGREVVTDAVELRAARRESRRIYLWSAALAAAITCTLLLVPA